jgi:23S rRNA (guanosine2251-2'-O)-methyltransferase
MREKLYHEPCMKSNGTLDKILILHDIRSSQNVGALLRSADAVGITRVYLTGITPLPIDRFGRPNNQLIKTSLGAELTVPWEHAEIESILSNLKRQGTSIIAVEQSVHAVDYKTIKQMGAMAVLLGNEVTGIPAEVLKEVDIIAEIPMRGKKESLNVSVAGGIALFRFFDR